MSEVSERAPDQPEPASFCANCGAPRTGAFCAQCGQAADVRPHSFVAWLKELASELFSIDGRGVRTLRDLFEPGRLSIDWVAGRRSRHLPPVRLFLLASLGFFSVAFLLGPIAPQEGMRSFNDAAVAAVARRAATEVVVLLVPVIALTLAIVLFRKRRFLLEHIVFALHAASVGLLLAALAWSLAHVYGGTRVGGVRVGLFVLLGFGLVTYAWVALAVRRFYGTGVLAAIGVVLALNISLGAVAKPLAGLTARRIEAYDALHDADVRAGAVPAFDASRDPAAPAELRRAAAAQAFSTYLELDQGEALTSADRARFACLAAELDMPEHAARIARLPAGAAVARCPGAL